MHLLCGAYGTVNPSHHSFVLKCQVTGNNTEISSPSGVIARVIVSTNSSPNRIDREYFICKTYKPGINVAINNRSNKSSPYICENGSEFKVYVSVFATNSEYSINPCYSYNTNVSWTVELRYPGWLTPKDGTDTISGTASGSGSKTFIVNRILL